MEAKMKTWPLISFALAAALLGLVICPLLLPTGVAANVKSEFPNPLCSPNDPNCVCPGGPTSNFCILQLRINNPQYVHMKLLGDWEYANVRQGEQQFEARPGEQIYVNRSKDGPTSFGIQFCQKTLTGSDCSSWATETLQEPSVTQLEACQDYADKAIAAVSQNKKLGCGFTGPRWSDDSKAHYNACAGNPALMSETAARDQQLQDCKNQKTAEAKPKDFNGSWSITTDKGAAFNLVMTQQGVVVTGQLISSNPQYSGTLTGTMEADGKVAFKFTQPGVPASGEGSFWLEGDTNNLDARFTLDNSNGAVHLFTGTRM
jgi:hypothetical protein